MIDFDKEREEIAKAYDDRMGKYLKEQEKKKKEERASYNSQAVKTKKNKPTRRKETTPEVKAALQKAQAEYVLPKFMANVTDAYLSNTIPGTVATLATGQKPNFLEGNPYEEQVRSGAVGTIGQLAGQGLAYAGQAAIASPITGALAGKVAKTGVGRMVAENAIDAGTVGLVQNLGINVGQGLRGEELVKQTAKDTALEFGLGTGLGGIAQGIGKLADSRKTVDLPTTKPQVEEVVEPATKQAETVDFEPKNDLPDANKYRNTEKGIMDKQGERLKEISDEYEKYYRLATSKSNKQSTGKIAEIERAKKAEYATKAKEITAEFEKIANMTEDEFAKYLRGIEPASTLKVDKGVAGTSDIKKTEPTIEIQEAKKTLDGLDKEALEMLMTGKVSPAEVRNAGMPNAENIIKIYEAERNIPKTNRKIKTNGVPEVHDKVDKFDVESSDIGIVNPDLKYVNDVIENGEGLFRKFYRYAVSGQEGLEKLAKASGDTRVDDYAQGVRNAKSTVTNIFNNGMFDSVGKKVDKKSYKSLIDAIPKKDREAFNTYAQHLHNIDRVREGVPVFKQYSAEQSQQIVDDLLKQHPEFADYTKNINEWWNKFVKTWLLDTGRITKESYEAMLKKYPNYIPTYRDPKKRGMGSLPNRANVGSGIKKATGGTSDVLPLEDNFLAQIDRIVTSTRKNDLYAALIDTLKKNPEKLKSYGVLTENKEVLKDTSLDELLTAIEEEGLKKVKDGTYMVTAYVDGKPVSAYVNESIMEALKLLDNAYGAKEWRFVSEIGRKFTNPVKAGITGYNPLFILANMSRDFPTYFIQSQHGVIKNFTGLGKAIGGMIKNNDLFQTYKAIGGKHGGYYAQGKGFEEALNEKGLKAIWSKFEKFMSFLGEGVETLPRFAEFVNSVEKYGDSKDGLMRALKDAGEVTVNFSRSAPITKTIDGWVLYLNAAVQGLDKFGRSVKNAPLKTLGKSAAVVTLPYVALMAANWDNPHYQDLTERIKQNYFCIPNILGEKDSEGNCMTFIKLPVNREYGALLGSSLDVMYGLVNGQTWEEATKGYKETLATNFAPPSMEDNIFGAFKDIKENKNYAGNKIVPTSLEEVDAKYQQDVKTSGAAKTIARGTNAVSENLGINLGETITSPMKVDYLIDQYGGYIGSVVQGATGSNVDSVGTALGGGFVDPFKQRFSADARYSSGVVSDFYDAKDKNYTERQNAKIEGDTWSEAAAKDRVYNDIADQLSESTKKEKEILGDKSLTKQQKNEKIKELRTERNEIARSAEKKVEEAAKEYRIAPTFSQLNSKIKEKYDRKSGLTKEQWGKAYNSQVKIDDHSQKIFAMLDNGVTTYEQAVSINSQISEEKFNAVKGAKKAGVTPKIYAEYARLVDKANDNNPDKDASKRSIDQDEVRAAFKQMDLTYAQKQYLWKCQNTRWGTYRG